MLFSQRDVRWTGVLRLTPVILMTIFAVSVVCLSLSVVRYEELRDRTLDRRLDKYHPGEGPSHTRLFFYCSLAPIISLIHSTVDWALYAKRRLAPLYSLFGSLVLLLGWLTQFSFLLGCEALGEPLEHVPDYCPTILINWMVKPQTQTRLTILSSFEGVAVIAYVVYMSFAATAVARARKTRKTGHMLGERNEREEHMLIRNA